MTKLQKLQRVTNKSELASLLDISINHFNYIQYNKELNYTRYSKFEIAKRSGGTRDIYAPNNDLKYLQRKLSILLLDCLDEIREKEKTKTIISHGFERKKSIITNALRHRNKKNILNLDLKNFFDTINFGRVRGFFIKNFHFNLPPVTATLIAQIACYDNRIPQGSPCSPVIANLICSSLDFRLNQLAKKARVSYTRYADDITFSTNMKSFIHNICTYDANYNIILSQELKKIIQKEGFDINTNKTRIYTRDVRQSVTGLTVNKKISVNKKYYKKTRAMCHNLFITGSFTTLDKKTLESRKGTLNELHGYLSFINSIDLYNFQLNKKKVIKSNAKQKDEKKLNKRERTFADFLFYKYVVNPQKATVITEGPTDQYHIKYALRALHKNYPQLITKAEPNSRNKLDVQLQFLRFSTKNDYFLDFKQGAHAVASFVISCLSRYNRINFFKNDHTLPALVIFDNDTAGIDSFDRIKKARENNKYFQEIFPNILNFKNIYVIKIPFVSGMTTTEIEDYYPVYLLEEKLDGKELNRTDNKCKDNQYSKSVFATNIIRTRSKDSDFEKFSPLLDMIQKIISRTLIIP